MDFSSDTADLFEPVGNYTFMDRKIAVVHFGDSFERAPLKKWELGGFSNGDKKTHLVPLVRRGDFQVLN
jgi:hypothetical protein